MMHYESIRAEALERLEALRADAARSGHRAGSTRRLGDLLLLAAATLLLALR
jgi:hypothetical protein